MVVDEPDVSVVGAGADVSVVGADVVAVGADLRVLVAGAVFVVVVAVGEDRRLDRRAKLVCVPASLEPICVPTPLVTVAELPPLGVTCVPAIVVLTGGRGWLVVTLALLIPTTNAGTTLPLLSTTEGSPGSAPRPDW